MGACMNILVSRYILRTALFFAFLFALPTLTNAQQKEITEGREFYFGIPHCDIQSGEGARGNPVQLWLSSKVSTMVTVTLPRSGELIGKFKLQPKKVLKVAIPETWMNKVTGVADNGIYVKSDEAITTTVYISYKWSGEAYRVIPAEVLGKRYYALSLYQDKTERERPGQILITATKDNTKVTVYPKAATEDNVAAGGAKTYTMMRGQTLLIKAKIQPGFTQDNSTDLTGTKIESSAPISVISGHTKGTYPRYQPTMLGTPANFMRNMLMDCMWPVEFLGKEYFSAPIMYLDRPRSTFDANSFGDLIRIVPTEDNTVIYTKTSADKDWQLRSKPLKAGEWLEFTDVEVPMMYKANKPILIGQYGKAWRSSNVSSIDPDKGGNSTQNPSRNGQGMLYVLTPKEQWCSYTTFHSPEGIDDFVMITFYSADIDKLTFDGKLLRATFGSFVKQVPNTDMSYVVAQVSQGDHTIEGAKFTAYVYGNWDRSKDGFAYGYPTGVNFSQTCPDTLTLNGEMICGTVNGEARILPDTSTCGALFSINMDESQSFNFDFKLDENFESGLKVGKFSITPKDVTKDAKAVVTAVSRSGKEVTKVFEYFAEKISVTPTEIDYGALALNQEDCTKKIVVTNTAKVPTTIKSLKLRKGVVEFTIKHGQLPITLQPGEKYEIEVCALAKSEIKTTVTDWVDAELSCFPQPLTLLKLKSGVPCVRIEDLTFGTQPINKEIGPRVCTITNSSAFDVVINKITYKDQDQNYPTVRKFKEDLSQNLPRTIPAYGNITFNVWYQAAKDGDLDTLTATLETNADVGCSDVVSVWTAGGTSVGPIISTNPFNVKRIIDKYNVDVLKTTSYPDVITLNATSNTGTPLQNASLKVDNASVVLPAGCAKWEDAFEIDFNMVPFTLYPDDPRQVNVRFKPPVVGDYKIKLILTAEFDKQQRSVEAEITGTGVVPYQDKTNWDFGTIPLNTTSKVEYVTVSSKDVKHSFDMPLEIKSLRVINDADNSFKIDPTWLSNFTGTTLRPFSSGNNYTLQIPVIYTSKKLTSQTAEIEVVCNLDASEVTFPQLKGVGRDDGTVDATDYNFGDVYKCNNSVGEISFTNNKPVGLHFVTLGLDNPSLSGTFTIDAADLSRVLATNYILAPGQTEKVSVHFTPLGDQNRRQATPYNANFIWEYEDVVDQNKGSEPSNVQGRGIEITVPISIPNTYLVDYDQLKSGKDPKLTMDFNIGSSPNSINDGRVTNYHAYIYYNPDFMLPIADVNSIKTQNTISNGWNVRKAVINNPGEFEVELADPNANTTNEKPLQGTGTLFQFEMSVFFNAERTVESVELPCKMDVTSSGCWVNIDPTPGLVTIGKGCANDIRHILIAQTQYALQNIKPNPVNSNATFEFSVAFAGQTTLTVFNSMGETMMIPVSADLKSGKYEVSVDVSNLTNGLYFYKLTSGSWTSETLPLVINK